MASSSDTTELLAQLRGIHLPEAPQAPAIWPLLLAGSIILLALALWLVKKRRTQTTWATEAINELKSIQQSDSVNTTLSIAILLKRIALTEDPENSVKHLSGTSWLKYLDGFFNTKYFSEGNGQAFGSDIYKHNAQIDHSVYRDLNRLIRRRQWFHD